jgi:hypothetical protein
MTAVSLKALLLGSELPLCCLDTAWLPGGPCVPCAAGGP